MSINLFSFTLSNVQLWLWASVETPACVCVCLYGSLSELKKREWNNITKPWEENFLIVFKMGQRNCAYIFYIVRPIYISFLLLWWQKSNTFPKTESTPIFSRLERKRIKEKYKIDKRESHMYAKTEEETIFLEGWVL